MSDLPAPVAEAGLLFRRAAIIDDPEAMRQVIDWGHQQIDVAYPLDPLRAPLNGMRRLRAHQEWDKVVRTAGKDLRGVIANAQVKELEFQLERRRTNILAEDATKRQNEAAIFNTRISIDAHRVTSRIDLDNQKELLTHQHNLQQDAEDRASERRIIERREAIEGDIARIGAEAIAKTIGTSSADEVFNTVTKVNEEVRRIRNDRMLTNDDKHSAIKTLLEHLPAMIYQATRYGQ